MLREAPCRRRGVAWLLPHVVDTALFLSGAIMVFSRHGGSVAQPWLLAKFGGILLYIFLGMLALRPGRPQAVRATAFVLALLVFAWIVAVARTRTMIFP